MALQLVPLGLAFAIALALGGLGALAFGACALVCGGWNQSAGGLGGFSERDIHEIAGLRMVAGGVVSLVFGALLLWSYLVLLFRLIANVDFRAPP